jgi:hypothetical protein
MKYLHGSVLVTGAMAQAQTPSVLRCNSIEKIDFNRFKLGLKWAHPYDRIGNAKHGNRNE